MPRLRHRKTRRRLISDSRGFSSIVGAVFAVLVMFSLISTVFVWSLSQNTLYNNTVTQTRQADLDRSNEKIVANVTVSRVNSSTVSVNGNLSNDGPLSAQIVTLWVVDNNTKNSAFKSPLSIPPLKPGDVTTLSGSTAVNVTLANSPGDSLSCWFISARGNTISKNPLSAGNNIVFANVAGGIGSISMDFKQFTHYDFTSKPGDGTTLVNEKFTYTILGTNYTIFHVVLTNLDPSGQDINLTKDSNMWAITPFSATVKGDAWMILNVTGGKVYPSSTNYFQILPNGNSADVYFGPAQGTRSAGNVVPLNILLFGKLGSNDYGQNLPFIALNVQ